MATQTLSPEELSYITDLYQSKGIEFYGIDLAKNVIQSCHYNFSLKRIVNKQITHKDFKELISGKSKSKLIIAFEACGSANYWARECTKHNHTYKCIQAWKVKSSRGMSKSDRIDAFAILRTALSPSIDSIKCKSEKHQLLDQMAKTRGNLIKQRTQTINILHSFLYEFGLPLKKNSTFKALMEKADEYESLLQEEDHDKAVYFRTCVDVYKGIYENCQELLKGIDKKLHEICSYIPEYTMLKSIPGVGDAVAMQLYIAGYCIENFKNAKHFAGFCAIAPHVTGTGGNTVCLGVRHYGNKDIASALYTAGLVRYQGLKKYIESDKAEGKLLLLREKSAKQIICAIANHIARAAYAVLTSKRPYDINKASGYLTNFGAI